MMKKMNYPADYAVLSNEEMTYTTGGGAVDDAASLATTAATVVGAVVLASSYIWGIKQARTWLQQDGNKDGNFFTVMAAPPMPLPPIWQIRRQLCAGCRFHHHGGGTGSPERRSADRALTFLIR